MYLKHSAAIPESLNRWMPATSSSLLVGLSMRRKRMFSVRVMGALKDSCPDFQQEQASILCYYLRIFVFDIAIYYNLTFHCSNIVRSATKQIITCDAK